MPRLVAALLASLVCLPCVVAGQPSRGAVDLDEPGVLEALERSHPAHYDKIQRILKDVLSHSDAGVPRWMQTAFHARDVKYLPILLTSHPPKRELSFTLDATRYDVVIVLTNVRGHIVPAR